MTRVQRYDRGTLRRARRTDEGFLLVDAYLTRPGVFEYLQADGSVRRELRPRDEVFDTSSLSTLFNKPTCLGHPTDDEGEPIFVDADNYNRFATGSIAGEAVADRAADRVRATLLICRRDHIDAIEQDELEEQSCGYTCEIEEAPGRDPEFGDYDVIQRQMRYNHTATVDQGRAGPDVRLRADAARMVHLPSYSEESDVTDRNEPTSEIKIDGLTYHVPPSVANALVTMDQRLQKLRADMDDASKGDDNGESYDMASFKKDMDAMKKDMDAMQKDMALVKDKLDMGDEPKDDKDDDGPEAKGDSVDREAWRDERDALEQLARDVRADGADEARTLSDAKLRRVIADAVADLPEDAPDAEVRAVVHMARKQVEQLRADAEDQASGSGSGDSPGLGQLISLHRQDHASAGGEGTGRAAFLTNLTKTKTGA